MGDQNAENLNDSELMEAYEQGDEAAFAELYQRYSKRLYGYLMKRCPSSEVADDLFQATFQKLHANRSRYDSQFPFSAWLFTICRNLLYDYFRKTGRSPEKSLPDYEELISNTPSLNTSQVADTPELSPIPAQQKKAVELRYFEELPFDEIAKRLETTPANARKLVSRGIARLKLLMMKP